MRNIITQVENGEVFELEGFDIEIEFESGIKNTYKSRENKISIGILDEYIVVHERLHAEIYCRGYFDSFGRVFFFYLLQSIAETKALTEGFDFNSILNYFQDYSVNTYLLVKRDSSEMELNSQRILADLSDKIDRGLRKLAIDERTNMGGRSDRILDLLSKISVVMGMLNFDAILGRRSRQTTELLENRSDCRCLYENLKRFYRRIRGRLVNRNDYTLLVNEYKLILDHYMR